MPISDSASPSVVKVSGLVDLYTTTLQRHGYASTATQAYKRAVEHFDEGQVIVLRCGTQRPLLLQVETKLIPQAVCWCDGWRYWGRNHSLPHQQIQQPLQSG